MSPTHVFMSPPWPRLDARISCPFKIMDIILKNGHNFKKLNKWATLKIKTPNLDQMIISEGQKRPLEFLIKTASDILGFSAHQRQKPDA